MPKFTSFSSFIQFLINFPFSESTWCAYHSEAKLFEEFIFATFKTQN